MANGEKKPTQFDLLCGELDTMAKALPAETGEDDTQIQAAANEGGDGGGDDMDEDGKSKAKAEGEPMAKSFEVTLPGGERAEAIDATEVIKSLQEQVVGLEGTMAKALGSAVELLKKQGENLAAQSTMVKSLNEQVAALRGEGRGRKAVVAITEKPGATSLAKSDPDGVTPEVFMVKAMEAFNAKRLTGTEVAVAEACINRGQQVPAHIVSRVLPQQ